MTRDDLVRKLASCIATARWKYGLDTSNYWDVREKAVEIGRNRYNLLTMEIIGAYEKMVGFGIPEKFDNLQNRQKVAGEFWDEVKPDMEKITEIHEI